MGVHKGVTMVYVRELQGYTWELYMYGMYTSELQGGVDKVAIMGVHKWAV